MNFHCKLNLKGNDKIFQNFQNTLFRGLFGTVLHFLTNQNFSGKSLVTYFSKLWIGIFKPSFRKRTREFWGNLVTDFTIHELTMTWADSYINIYRTVYLG